MPQKKDPKKEFEEYKKLAESLDEEMSFKSFKSFSKNLKDARQELASFKQIASEVEGDFLGAARAFHDAVDEIQNGKKALKETVSATNKLASLAQDMLYDKEEIVQMDEKSLQKLIQQVQKEQVRLKIAKMSGDVSGDQLKQLEATLKQSDHLLAGAKKRLATERQIVEKMGFTGAAMKGMSSIVDKLGMGSLVSMEEVTDHMRDVAEDGGNKWKVLTAGIDGTLGKIGDTLKDSTFQLVALGAAIKGIISLALEYRDKQYEAGKALGIGVTESGKLLNNFRGIAVSNSNLAMTGKQLVETYSQINDQLGFMGPQNAEFLTTTAAIERRIGASAEQMERLQAFAMGSGRSLKDTYATVVNSAKAMGARLRLNMSEKQILSEISKVSTGVLLNMKGNVPALAAAVVQAKKFGTTLDTIASQGEQLLDFEGSMQKQMEFQLLTGKELDLSKARELALNNDTVGLMQEMNRLGIKQGDYEKMNFLQRQSYSEAIGLSKDKLDEIYHNQSLANELGEQAGQQLKEQYDAQGNLIGQQSAADAMRASAQEKMTAAMENMKDSLGQMLGPIANMSEAFMGWVTNIDNLKILLAGAGAVMTLLAARAMIISAQKQRQVAAETELVGLQIEASVLQAKQVSRNTAMLAQIAGITAEEEAQVIVKTEAAGVDIVDAAAKTAAANAPATMGFGSLIAAGAVAAGLWAMMSSIGGKSKSAGGGMGGASLSAAMPPEARKMTEPVNAAAAGAENVNKIRALGTGETLNKGTNVDIKIFQDPIHGSTIKSTIAADGRASYDVSKNINPAKT